MDQEIYKLYKPLRNHLKQVSIENAFYVIWAYMNFLQFNGRLPRDIEFPLSFVKNKNSHTRGLYEWELALLAREVITNSQGDHSLSSKKFNQWAYFSSAINKLKEFENKIWPVVGESKDILRELQRAARRQFPWQVKPSSVLFVRYFKIFNNKRISETVEKHLGLSVQTWYTVGTAMLGAMITHAKFNIDPKIEIAGLTRKDFDKFISYTSTTIEELRKIINRDVKYNDEFVYSFNPLEYYPFISIGEYYYCPINTFAAWRITSGIYYDIDKRDGGFCEKFGLAFQDYLQEVAEKVLDKNIYKILGEQKYFSGKKSKDSIDLIIGDKNHAFFIEAKTKRLSAKSKSEFLSDEALTKDITVLAEAIVQTYETIHDYKENLYPFFPYDSNCKIYPMIVTLEEWFLMGEELSRLKMEVKRQMSQKDIPEDYLENMPYTVSSTLDFESLVQVLVKNPIQGVMSEWLQPNQKEHGFGRFLATQYLGQIKYIDDFFPGDFEKIYPKGLVNPVGG